MKNKYLDKALSAIVGIFILIALFPIALFGLLIVEFQHLSWLLMAAGPVFSIFIYLLIALESLVLLWITIGIVRSLFKQKQSIDTLFSHLLGRLEPLESPLVPNWNSKIKWFLSKDNDAYAFSTGTSSPSVVVSQGLWDALDDEQRKAVLYHEYYHLQSKDGIKQKLMQALSEAIPVSQLRFLQKHYSTLTEIKADANSIEAMKGDRFSLGGAMLAAYNVHLDAVSNWSDSLDERIEFLSRGKLPKQKLGLWIKVGVSPTVALAFLIAQGVALWCHY